MKPARKITKRVSSETKSPRISTIKQRQNKYETNAEFLRRVARVIFPENGLMTVSALNKALQSWTDLHYKIRADLLISAFSYDVEFAVIKKDGALHVVFYDNRHDYLTKEIRPIVLASLKNDQWTCLSGIIKTLALTTGEYFSEDEILESIRDTGYDLRCRQGNLLVRKVK